MNYIITGGTGFIGTHLANLIKEQDENARVWNLDIVDPEKLDGLNEELRMKNEESASTKEIYKRIEEYTTIKQWKSPVKDGEKRKSTFVYCDVRKPIENLPFTPTPTSYLTSLLCIALLDILTMLILRRIFVEQRMCVLLRRNGE